MTGGRVTLLALALAACSERLAKEDPPGEPEGGAAPTIAAIARKPLDTLAPKEAEVLCQEDFTRTDPCVELARTSRAWNPDEKACDDLVAQCRAGLPEKPPPIDCSGVTIVPGSCPVTVEAYLACVDAARETFTCKNAGYLIPTPEPCKAIEKACPDLAVFHSPGVAPPCPEGGASPPDTDDDIFGLDACRPAPSRFVVLGDSIADCTTVTDAQCAPNLIAGYLRAKYAPGLTYDMQAVAGARTEALPTQAAQVAGGPGHVYVWVYAIGNDLLAGVVDYPSFEASWQQVFDYFGDTKRFPDGATFLMNTQYSPYDECEPGDPEKTLREVNKRLFLDVAVARPDTVAIDHLPDWLGHGKHADEGTCPHCGADNSKWVFTDGVHPNAVGYARMVEKWKIALDETLGDRAGCGAGR